MVTPQSLPRLDEHSAYTTAIALYCHFSKNRRQDMVFVTSVQGAALTLAGSQFVSPAAKIAVSIVAFGVCLLGFNTERRGSSYMRAYADAASRMERNGGIDVVTSVRNYIRECPENRKQWSERYLVSNSFMFPLYYGVLVATWPVLWILRAIA